VGFCLDHERARSISFRELLGHVRTFFLSKFRELSDACACCLLVRLLAYRKNINTRSSLSKSQEQHKNKHSSHRHTQHTHQKSLAYAHIQHKKDSSQDINLSKPHHYTNQPSIHLSILSISSISSHLTTPHQPVNPDHNPQNATKHLNQQPLYPLHRRNHTQPPRPNPPRPRPRKNTQTRPPRHGRETGYQARCCEEEVGGVEEEDRGGCGDRGSGGSRERKEKKERGLGRSEVKESSERRRLRK